jgi:uncharacterized protein with HEPN domain
VSRRDAERLGDVLAVAETITAHLQRGEITDGLIFDAVRVQLIEIGGAVVALDPELIAHEPDIAWADIKGMRNHLAHRNFDTADASSRTPLLPTCPRWSKPPSRCSRASTSNPTTAPNSRIGTDSTGRVVPDPCQNAQRRRGNGGPQRQPTAR